MLNSWIKARVRVPISKASACDCSPERSRQAQAVTYETKIDRAKRPCSSFIGADGGTLTRTGLPQGILGLFVLSVRYWSSSMILVCNKLCKFYSHYFPITLANCRIDSGTVRSSGCLLRDACSCTFRPLSAPALARSRTVKRSSTRSREGQESAVNLRIG